MLLYYFNNFVSSAMLAAAVIMVMTCDGQKNQKDRDTGYDRPGQEPQTKKASYPLN